MRIKNTVLAVLQILHFILLISVAVSFAVFRNTLPPDDPLRGQLDIAVVVIGTTYPLLIFIISVIYNRQDQGSVFLFTTYKNLLLNFTFLSVTNLVFIIFLTFSISNALTYRPVKLINLYQRPIFVYHDINESHEDRLIGTIEPSSSLVKRFEIDTLRLYFFEVGNRENGNSILVPVQSSFLNQPPVNLIIE